MREPTRGQAPSVQLPVHNVEEASPEREARSHQEAGASRMAEKNRLSCWENVFISVDPLEYQCRHPIAAIRTGFRYSADNSTL